MSLYTKYTPNISKGVVFQPRTLADWMSRRAGQATGGRGVYGYFGPGAFLSKDITTAGDSMGQSDFFNNTFGAKVWDSLNSQTRFFNMLRKVAWGNTTGYRIRSGRNLSTQGVGETAALPTIDTLDLQTIFLVPKFVVTSMGVSALSQFLATLEGGLGDALAVAQEAAMIDHNKKINQMVTARSEIRVETGGGSPDTLVDGAARSVTIGDTFHYSGDEAAGKYIVVTGGSGGADTPVLESDDIIAYTITGGGAAPATDEIIFTRTRSGFHSINDIVATEGRTINGVAVINGPMYGSLTFGARDAGGWNVPRSLFENAGTLRHLTTGLLDQAIDAVRIAGGEPDLLMTGIEQVTRIGTILQANQHFIDKGEFQVKVGGEATLRGYQTGFPVATYKGIAMIHDVDAPKVTRLAANGDAERGADVLALDTRFLEVPVLFTTQYMESRDYLQNNMLGIKAVFLTAGELRCLDFRKQCRISDLSDGVNLT